jgi:hypothetical protein
MAAENLGATPPGGLPMVELLAEHGANPDFAQGQGLCHSCEMGRFDAATIILALRPSRGTRSRALHHLLKCDSPSSALCSMVDSLIGSSRNHDPTARILKEPLPSFSEYQKDYDSAIRVLLRNRPGDSQALRKVLENGHSVGSGRYDIGKSAYTLAGNRRARERSDLLVHDADRHQSQE